MKARKSSLFVPVIDVDQSISPAAFLALRIADALYDLEDAGPIDWSTLFVMVNRSEEEPDKMSIVAEAEY